MSTSFNFQFVCVLVLALGNMLCTANPLVASPPSSAQSGDSDAGCESELRQQRFATLEEAATRAYEEIDTPHRFEVAALVYRFTAPDRQTVRGMTELHFVGGGRGGYSPGSAKTADAVLQPVFIHRLPQAVELHIMAPGYEKYVRRGVLYAGELTVWDDIVLAPITHRTAATVMGRVWLEDESESLEGMVVTVDQEPVTFTDASGYFVATPVRAGNLRIAAYKPGYLGMCAELKVDRAAERACKLKGFRKRYARVRWAYQPDGTRSFVNGLRTGTAVLSVRELSRVSFAEGFTQVSGFSDFLVEQKNDRLMFRHFDQSGFNSPESIRLEHTSLDGLAEAPESGYKLSEFPLRPGEVYVFRCYDGEHYGMMEVLDITVEPPSDPPR